MLPSRRSGRALLTASAMVLAMGHFASAEDADTQEVQRYTLTDTALAKYTNAAQRLAALPGGTRGACENGEDDATAESLDDMAATLDAIPGARAAIQSAGMTSREYVLFSLSLLQNGLAAWAVSQPGGKLPPGISKANVDFVQKHDAELQQLHALKPRDDCDEESQEDDADE